MLVYPYTASCPTTNYYGGVKYNTYEGNYTFASNTGTYIFGMVDPNLDNNVNNIPSSGNVAFAVLDTLSLSNFGAGYNNSALASNPLIDSACAGQVFYYNPSMIDTDGDSLSYSLIPYITGIQNTGPFFPVSGYSAPTNLTINAVTGELSWLNTPTTYGEYDVDILIREYRHVGSSIVEMGSTVFAVQLNVICCTTSGIERVKENKEQINIYPNPNNGSFVIEPSNLTKQTIQLYDVNGKLVLSQTINGKTTVDASSLNEGVYNISLLSNEGVVNKRLVIVR
jgi:type IX secretion system substrate protein/putative Ig domain-containing protein